MYQEETYEPNEDEAREAAQLADENDRFESEAEEMLAQMWAGVEMPGDYRSLAVGMAREFAGHVRKEVA